MGRVLRNMKTTQERRAWFASDAPLRSKRAPKVLPSVYDDYWRYPQRTWKRHRENQYRPH